MENFVLSQKKTLQVKIGKRVVYLRYPLRHPHVLGIYRVELKLQEGPGGGRP